MVAAHHLALAVAGLPRIAALVPRSQDAAPRADTERAERPSSASDAGTLVRRHSGGGSELDDLENDDLENDDRENDRGATTEPACGEPDTVHDLASALAAWFGGRGVQMSIDAAGGEPVTTAVPKVHGRDE